MGNQKFNIALIGAGTIGTALGNILAEAGTESILLHSIEEQIVEDINRIHINSKYFPTLHLHHSLYATTDERMLEHCKIIFLAIPSVIMVEYLKKIQPHLPPDAILLNLAKGFGLGNRTIPECLTEEFPNPLGTLKGPSFAREIINRLPTGFTLGYQNPDQIKKIKAIFKNTNIHLDYSDDIRGVEILSILKNIYAVVLGIVDAQFNSPNLRFLILTKAFQEMRKVLLYFGGRADTLFNYCGYGDFTLTALNYLSRNRTLGLLIGKGFFTEHVSHELVLEGKTAADVFYQEISKTVSVEDHFPIIAELYRIFHTKYDISLFVNTLLNFPEE
ncbi:MAG: NAD(P)-binding domain-containing protein [Bacteroidetes bacterium]|nr:NAD(P)-binding domain-containing protein [Bacteroidota bacterium]